jgi:4-diphosphocytidyl-2-C-methyl-D-erythritol kinase
MSSTDASLSLPAPAKLNLFLHITGRRPDGYHDLQTVFQLLDYGDELTFTRQNGNQLDFSCSDPTLAGSDNLVLRAARLLQAQARQPCGMHIHLYKRLPAGGGLGGGSSDAATALVALNALWDCGLERSSLMALGRLLGADVPVFVSGHSAWAEGVGEKLQTMELPERWYVVLTPACHASTAHIFGHPELTRDSAPLRIPRFPFPGTRNDCQAVATLLHPEIQQALDWLSLRAESGLAARMTGTGSSVFAVYTSREAATDVLAQWRGAARDRASEGASSSDDTPGGGFVAKGCNRSPLYRELGEKLQNYWGVAKR